MSPRRLLAAISLLGLVLLPAQAALATIITFENDTGGPLGPNFTALTNTTCGTSGLGDLVASAVQGSCSYGNGGEGFTPNVGVEFLATHAIQAGPVGDLVNVGFKQSSGQIEIMLTADVDFEVELFGFDIAFTGGSIGAVQVRDGETNDLLFNDFGSTPGATHLSYDFELLIGQSLMIKAPSNVSIDNIRFGQIPEAVVPEPSTAVLLGVGLLFAAGRRGRPAIGS